MAPFTDPHMEQLKEQYYASECDPKFFYQGSQESIIEELKAWVVRRKEVYKAQMKSRHESQKSTRENFNSPAKALDPESIRVAKVRYSRAMVLDDESNEDGARAAYLLDVLKSRGLTWAELWWRPETDGGVCSFLGTVDAKFDAHATLTILEAKEEEEGLQANAAELEVLHKPVRERAKAGLAKMRGATGGGQMPQGGGQASGSPGESSSTGASTDGEPAVVTRAKDKVMATLAVMLANGSIYNAQAEGSDKKKSRQEKRAEARQEAKGKATDSEQATK